MQVDTQQLRDFLLDANLISEEQFNECVKTAQSVDQKIDEVLVSKGLISPEELTKLKAYILGIPYVNLEKEVIPLQILQLIPEAVARANNIVAFRRDGDVLEVAMLDPEDLQIIEFIKKTTGLKVVPRLTSIASVKNILVQYQKTLQAEFGDLVVSKNESAGGLKSLQGSKTLENIKMTNVSDQAEDGPKEEF